MFNIERFINEKVTVSCKNQDEWNMMVDIINIHKINGRNIVYGHYYYGRMLVYGYNRVNDTLCTNIDIFENILKPNGWTLVPFADMMQNDYKTDLLKLLI